MEGSVMSKLTIKSFHIDNIESGDKTIINKGMLTYDDSIIQRIINSDDLVVNMKVDIIYSGDYNRETNTIMDILPISAKVLGRLGEGITHTLTGVVIMLTGSDENGRQLAGFGSSEGILSERIILDMSGTPSVDDIIIHVDVTVAGGHINNRIIPFAAFRACDEFIQNIRNHLKLMDGSKADEIHKFKDRIRTGRDKIVIVKQIAGQGANYDNQLFPDEPGGIKGGRSIIDLGNMPVILSPNEYRDGAIRSMT